MLICGIKASHDGGVALIDDDRLRFSIEMEKLANAPRYSFLEDLARVAEVLDSEGVSLSDVDRFVVDGWWTEGAAGTPAIRLAADGESVDLPVAPYVEGAAAPDPLHRYTFAAHHFNGDAEGYSSYHHASNHLIGAYSSSPFAARGEDALVLIWDGGMVPRLYQVVAETREVAAVSALLPLTGSSFADFSSQFDPFRLDTDGLHPDEVVRKHLSVAGKAMAYAALGRVEPAAFAVFDEIMADFSEISVENSRALGEKLAVNRDELLPGLSEADLIATYQEYLGERLLSRLSSVVRRSFPGQRHNLALGGGCALNIKWNSMLRNSGLFDEIWVPPFPNDSGAAIGTAACEMFRTGGHLAFNWDVYCGPSLRTAPVAEGWSVRPCDERQLAELLHTEGEPVVVLSGRAEIGPRALGNRSILAPATDPAMKDRLNRIKDRADYRPVAPICLSSRASEVFDPGCRDPYMLFEHRVRSGWTARVPAVIHLDGTARLQTIDESHHSVTGRILAAYERFSGVPVLCNTSANLNGRGFFPDVASALGWGRTRYVWSEGELYTNRAAAHDRQNSGAGRA